MAFEWGSADEGQCLGRQIQSWDCAARPGGGLLAVFEGSVEVGEWRGGKGRA